MGDAVSSVSPGIWAKTAIGGVFARKRRIGRRQCEAIESRQSIRHARMVAAGESGPISLLRRLSADRSRLDPIRFFTAACKGASRLRRWRAVGPGDRQLV